MAKSGSPNSLAHIQETFSIWHASIAKPLLPNPGQDPRDNPWHMVLIATSYRFQCMLFRWLRKHWEANDSLLSENANSCLKLAMYELDAMIGRALAYDMLRNLPIALYVNNPPSALNPESYHPDKANDYWQLDLCSCSPCLTS